MQQRTYRYLENQLRLGPLGLKQWVQLFFACLAVVISIKVFGIPVKWALPIGIYVIGVPTALAALSDDFDFSISARMRSSGFWLLRRLRLRGDDAPRLLNAEDFAQIKAITRDGLLLRSDGTFMRALKVTAFNPLVIDDATAAKFSRALSGAVGRLEANCSLQFFVEGHPVGLGGIIDEARYTTGLAINDCKRADEWDRASALARLETTSEQSITRNSTDIAAMEMTYYVLCPYNPTDSPMPSLFEREPTAHLTAEAIEQGSLYTDALAKGIAEDLKAQHLSAESVNGIDYVEMLGRHLSGRSFDFGQLVGVFDDLDDVPAIHAALAGSAATERLKAALIQKPLDFADAKTFSRGGELGQTAYMSEIPESTWFGQPLQMMQIGQPFTYSTHVTATDRVRERRRYRNRFKQIRGLNTNKMRRNKHVAIEAELQEAEAEALLADLTTTIGSGIFEVSTYITVYVPKVETGERVLRETMKAIRREATASDDARYGDGMFDQHALFLSSLPIALDRANRTKRFVSRNVGDLVPLVGSTCGSPSGVVIGHSSPGHAIERIDPFDPIHENHLVVISGKSGSGKSMCANTLSARWLAQGARGYVIDRAGHYSFLASLIPGAAQLTLGPGDGHYVINPWDVADARDVPAEKISFLLDLHALLLGDGADDGDRRLTALEASILETAIRRVYSDAVASSVSPTESHLRDVLMTTADAGDEIIRHTARSLAHRLEQFVGEGSYSYLLDRPTNVLEDAPMTIFDTQAIPEVKLGAAVLLIAEYVTRHIKARRKLFLDGASEDQSVWAGRAFLLFDETWALLESSVTGRWFNEIVRRSRHYALVLVAISQQLSDFKGKYGEAFRRQSTIQIYFKQSEDDLKFAAETNAFSDAAMELLAGLTTSKRQYARAFLVNGARGQGVIDQRYGPLEYWLATNDPIGDEPIRRKALRASQDDPWAALKLLADPTWQAENALVDARPRHFARR